MTCSRRVLLASCFALALFSGALCGCSGSDNKPIPEAEQKQQMQQLNQQRADEWGNKPK